MSNADGTPLAGAPVRGRSFRGRFIGLNVSGGGGGWQAGRRRSQVDILTALHNVPDTRHERRMEI